MAQVISRKVLLLIFIVLLSESVFTTLVRKSLNPTQDCAKEFQDKCVKECSDLKRILCYCKDYKVLEQVNHKCLCAADKSECDKELESFIKKLQ
jgi:hypothetical protein